MESAKDFGLHVSHDFDEPTLQVSEGLGELSFRNGSVSVILCHDLIISAPSYSRYTQSLDDTKPTLEEKAESLGIGRIRRHIFLCAEQTKPKCAPHEVNIPAWEYLKRRLVDLGLTAGEQIVYRTKANCLRICQNGPIAVVYPDGSILADAQAVGLREIGRAHV